jgi:hypothetical protein
MSFPLNPAPGDTHIEFNTTWVYGGSGWYRSIVGSGNETDYRSGKGFISGDLDVTGDLDVGGDINLDDGGSFQTTLQLVTPTANRTVTFPDATGTVGLVAGSSGNLVVNQSGAYAGVANSSVDNATGNITLGSRFISSLNGAASAPPATLTGTWFTGGTATTTKPQLLLEPAGTTSTAWSTAGTGLGINAASGFTGQLLDLQVNGTSRVVAGGDGRLLVGTSSALAIGPATPAFQVVGSGAASWAGILRTGATTAGSNFVLAQTRGSVSSRTVAQAGDVLGTIHFAGDDGVTVATNAATIVAAVDGTPGANDMPGRLVFSTTADGASSPTERLRITNAGVLQVADAGDITVGTTTGTKIGTATTQKLGFFNATPVVQPTAVADSVDTTDIVAQFNALLSRMRDLGLIAT